MNLYSLEWIGVIFIINLHACYLIIVDRYEMRFLAFFSFFCIPRIVDY